MLYFATIGFVSSIFQQPACGRWERSTDGIVIWNLAAVHQSCICTFIFSSHLKMQRMCLDTTVCFRQWHISLDSNQPLWCNYIPMYLGELHWLSRRYIYIYLEYFLCFKSKYIDTNICIYIYIHKYAICSVCEGHYIYSGDPMLRTHLLILCF